VIVIAQVSGVKVVHQELYHRLLITISSERKVGHEFVEPDDKALTLPLVLKQDDSQLGKSIEFLVNVLHVPINNSCSVVDAGWFFSANRLDEIEVLTSQ